MQVLSLVWGILAIVGVGVAFTPCLGSLNWFVLPFAGIGIIVSIVAYTRKIEEKKGSSIAGIVCCGVAILVGIIRLVAGGGVL